MSQEQPSGLREAFRVMRPGAFRRYMTGEAISSTGTWMQMMAQSWVMTNLTQSAFMLGLVNFASGIPQLALTMMGGSFADKYDKRVILQICQVVQIGLAVLTGWLIATNRISMWLIIAMAAVLGVSNAFEMPAVTAFVPEIVEKEEIASAIAVDRTIFHATRLVGPSLAGLVVGLWGAATAFYANALSFLPLMAALSTVKPRPQGSEEEEAARGSGMQDGIRYVRSDKPTLAMIAVLAMNTVFIMPTIMIMMPLYARQELHIDAKMLGFMMALSAAGSLTGAIGLLGVKREQRVNRLMLAVGLIAVSMIMLSAAHTVPVASIALLTVTTGISSVFGLANTTIQERAPDHLRGRVSAIAGMSFFGLQPVAGLVITSLADRIGMRPSLLAAAICFGVGALGVLAGPGREAAKLQSQEVEPIATP